MNFKKLITTKEYDFLRTNEHLGNNIILIGLGGSYAYGTNLSNSDIDIRGIATNTKRELLIGEDFEQVVDTATDTTIYSLNKMISLLSNCNPNTVEILGLDNYIYLNDIGKDLLDNKKLFLSKKCVKSFTGFYNQQIYRLKQKEKTLMSQSELETHILKTLQSIKEDFSKRYELVPESGINLYIDNSNRADYDTEIFMDIDLKHYPLRDYCDMWNDLKTVVSSYKKLGKRNDYAIEHGRLAKHMMHTIRLQYMLLDILEKEEIITYRTIEHDLLMDIRNGKFLTEDYRVKPEFYDLTNDLEKKIDYAKSHTALPEEPNYDKINDFKAMINEKVINCSK